MRILAFDTTTSACSVAIWLDGKTIGSHHNAMVRGQAEALLPAIEQTMADAETSYNDLDRIAVAVGPGSFTGVRVGLATARGIGVATGLPVIGVLTTEIIAAETADISDSRIAVAIDARRAEVYLHCFDSQGNAQTEPECLLPETAAKAISDGIWILAGDGAERVISHCGASVTQGELSTANAAVLARIAATQPIPDSPPSPAYVRPPDAIVPKHGGRLRP